MLPSTGDIKEMIVVVATTVFKKRPHVLENTVA